MPYARVDVSLDGHPKAEQLSDAALGLWLRGLVYASRLKTDGYLPSSWVQLHVRSAARRREARELVERGWWHRNADGYLIHDYLDWQRSAAEISADTERKRRAGALGGRPRSTP